MARANTKASRRSRHGDSPATLRMTAKLARWGSYLGLRIPSEVVRQLRLAEGDTVSVEMQPDCITIRPMRQRRRWTLNALLKGVTPAMVGGETGRSKPVGKELW